MDEQTNTSTNPTAGGIAMGEGYGVGDEPGADHRGWPAVLESIGAARSWWICSTRASGRAHAMPVWGVVVAGRIVWSTGPHTVKAKNMRREPHMVMHLESGDDVVIVEARAAEIDASALPDGFVAAYTAKYGFEIQPADEGYSFWELHPTSALVWDEAHFAETAVKWSFA